MTIYHLMDYAGDTAINFGLTSEQHDALITARLVFDHADGNGACCCTLEHMEACNHDSDHAVYYIEGFLAGKGLPYPEPDDVRHALAKLTWDGPTDSDGEPCFYVNHYHCDDCDEDWEDQWSCGCDDECPQCGQDVSPHESIDVTLQSTDAEQVAAFEQALVKHDKVVAEVTAQREADYCATCGREHTE